MSKKMLLALVIVGKLVLSVLICSYFWNTSDLLSLKQLPYSIIAYAVLYIGLQMLTRKLSSVNNWWDWVYYGGLLSIMIPVSFANQDTLQIFEPMTDFGTICLILPALVDGYYLIIQPSQQK